MNKKEKEIVKKYVISSLITFVTAFAVTVLPTIDTLTLETVKQGALVGAIFSGLRAGFKAIFEHLASKA